MREKTSKGTIAFRAVYLTLSVIAVIAVCAVIGWLSDFLTDYESSQQKYVINDIVAELESGELSKVFSGTEIKVSDFENEQTYKDAFAATLNGKFTCIKNQKESTEKRPVYTLKSDGKAFASLALKEKADKTKHGFSLYEFDTVYGIDVPKNESVTITAPENYKITVNGTALTSAHRKKTEAVPLSDKFGDYLSQTPMMATYYIDGLINAPVVFATDESGKECSAQYDEKAKTYTYPFGKCENKEAEAFAFEFSHRYSEYIADDIGFGQLSPYIDANAKLYLDMYYYEGKYYSWHSDYDFRNEETVEVLKYSDDCLSVRVKYDHVIIYGGEDHIYPADNTVYLVKNGDSWKAVNVVMN